MASTVDPLVYVIILNWNGWRDTLACLESLRALDYPSYRIVVVDNASSDESEARIRAAVPEITLIQSGANLGFAGGNNVGIHHALQQGAEYIWLLNNDTLVDRMALTALVQRAESDSRIGFVGSKIVFASQPDLVWFAGGTVLRFNGATAHDPSYVPDDDRLPPAHETMFVCGCSALVRRRVVEEIGGMPEAYFFYYEDVDWQFSARARNWKILYEPASVVQHKVSASAGIETPFATFQSARSHMLFVRRHLPKALTRGIVYTLHRGVMRDLRRAHWRLALARSLGMTSGLIHGIRQQAKLGGRGNAP